MSSMTKLCVVGVLLTVSVLPSRAIEPEDITLHGHVSDAIAAPVDASGELQPGVPAAGPFFRRPSPI